MKKLLSNVHYVLSMLMLIGILAEFYFAGMGVFHASNFEIHKITGVLLWAGSALLLVAALIGKTGRGIIGTSLLLFVLMFIQPMLLQIHQPFMEALHPLNATLILAASLYLVRLGIMKSKQEKI